MVERLRSPRLCRGVYTNYICIKVWVGMASHERVLVCNFTKVVFGCNTVALVKFVGTAVIVARCVCNYTLYRVSVKLLYSLTNYYTVSLYYM